MQAIYPFVGGTSTTHKWNLKDPQNTNAAFRLVFNGGFTHSSNGMKGNGVNSYANTYYIQQTHLVSQDNLHISLYSRTNVSEAKDDMGVRDSASPPTTRTNIVLGRNLSDSYGFATNNTFITYPDTSSLGHIITNRIASNIFNSYRNGVLKNTSNSVSVKKANYAIFIGANNLEGNSFASVTKEFAFATIGLGLSNTQASNFYTAVQTFQTKLGRNV